MYYATSGAQVTGAMQSARWRPAHPQYTHAGGRRRGSVAQKARLALTHPQWDAARGATMMAG